MAKPTKIVCILSLLVAAVLIGSVTDAHAGHGTSFLHVTSDFHGHGPPGIHFYGKSYFKPVVKYHVFIYDCGSWKCCGKYPNFMTAKYKAHKIRCLGYKVSIKRVWY